MGVGAIAASFIIQFIVGAAAGYVLGKLAIRMLNKLNIDNQALYPILLLAFVFFTFSITDLLKGNGYLAVYIAGIMVGNNKIMHRKDIYTFMDGLTWLFQIIMFLLSDSGPPKGGLSDSFPMYRCSVSHFTRIHKRPNFV